MKTSIVSFWYKLVSNFWFTPSFMVAGAACLWLISNLIDSNLLNLDIQLWWVYTGGLDGARSLLSAIAGSAIAVAATIFSITIVVLSFASRQFGSRLLRSFINDKGNQVVLGTFLATFFYCLLMLSSLRGSGTVGSVPPVGVMLALLMAAGSIGVLIYYIHHIAVSIQSSHIINAVAVEMINTIDRVFPQKIKEDSGGQELKEEPAVPDDFQERAGYIYARKSGYVQVINIDTLLDVAVNNDMIIHALYRTGDFVNQDAELAAISPGERLNEEIENRVRRAFALGLERTPVQDIGYSIDRLVQIMVIALSPSYNDPFTAITCLDWMAVALCDLANRKIPTPNHFDGDGKIRVLEQPLSFPSFLDIALDKLHHNIQAHRDVLVHLLQKMALIARCTHREEDRRRLLYHAYEFKHMSEDRLTGGGLKQINEHYDLLVAAITQTHD
jgi:uncharacterized membrane protein